MRNSDSDTTQKHALMSIIDQRLTFRSQITIDFSTFRQHREPRATQ